MALSCSRRWRWHAVGVGRARQPFTVSVLGNYALQVALIGQTEELFAVPFHVIYA
jgi:hypothetical protein